MDFIGTTSSSDIEGYILTLNMWATIFVCVRGPVLTPIEGIYTPRDIFVSGDDNVRLLGRCGE